MYLIDFGLAEIELFNGNLEETIKRVKEHIAFTKRRVKIYSLNETKKLDKEDCISIEYKEELLSNRKHYQT